MQKLEEKENSKRTDIAKAESDMLWGFDSGYNKRGNDPEVQKALKENTAFATGYANGQEWRKDDDARMQAIEANRFWEQSDKGRRFEEEPDIDEVELAKLKELDRIREHEEERDFENDLKENELDDISEFKKDMQRVIDAGYNRLADTDPVLKEEIESSPLYAEWYESGEYQRDSDDWQNSKEGQEWEAEPDYSDEELAELEELDKTRQQEAEREYENDLDNFRDI